MIVKEKKDGKKKEKRMKEYLVKEKKNKKEIEKMKKKKGMKEV